MNEDFTKLLHLAECCWPCGGGSGVNHHRLSQGLDTGLYRNVPLPLFYVHLLGFAQFCIVFQLSTLWFSDSLSLVADCRKLEFNDIQCAYVFVSFTVSSWNHK